MSSGSQGQEEELGAVADHHAAKNVPC